MLIQISNDRGGDGTCGGAVWPGQSPSQGRGSDVVVDVVVAVLGNWKNEEIPQFQNRKKENLC